MIDLTDTERDMISHGDMIGRELGEKVLALIDALRAERDALAGEVERQRALLFLNGKRTDHEAP